MAGATAADRGQPFGQGRSVDRAAISLPTLAGAFRADHVGALVLRLTWLPVTGPVQTDLLAIVRSELRPVPIEHKPRQEAA